MVWLLRPQTIHAIRLEASLEEANRLVREKGFHAETATVLDLVQHAQQFTLAVAVAKIMERPWREDTDVASIPELARLLEMRDVRRLLIWTALKTWSGRSQARSCGRAIRRALGVYQQLQSGSELGEARNALQMLRNKELAHSLWTEALVPRPRYNDLFALVDIAQAFLEHADLAIRGANGSFDEHDEFFTRLSRDFWTPALTAAAAYDPHEMPRRSGGPTR
ncbi:hypothetical protein [Hansschlegelia plantiphila]|nr:hypothetical protein [Hansschlegelia plantiphila]